MTHHIDSVKAYVGVFVALIILTFTTVTVSQLELGEFHIIVALLIAFIKASLVAWIFMGVRHSAKMTRLFVVAGLLWLGIMMLITFGDYTTRAWDYHPQPWSQSPTVGGEH
jgi:cytochrome c oxidase subunit 4